MRFSKNYPATKDFFKLKDRLSEKVAFLFVLEEAVLAFLLVLQAYWIIGLEITEGGAVAMLSYPVSLVSIAWFLITVLCMLMMYVFGVQRDRRVWLVHKNFSRIFLGTVKLKFQFTSRRKAVFFIAECIYAVVLAVAIAVYLDPDINLVPAPFNYIGFIAMAIIGLYFFSHSKEYRAFMYGATPLQKHFNLGHHPLKRHTNLQSGSIRIGPKQVFAKKRSKK